MRRIVVALAALAVVAMSSRAPAGLALIKRVGPHFRVLCHFDDSTSAEAALETAEAIWPRAAELYGLPDAPLDPPLDVHLYRRAEDYLAVERELVGGKFDRNLAFSSFDTASSYVPVQPDLTDDALASVGLTAQTRHNVAHEATHLVSYRATPNFRSFPQWATEGAAVWVESETATARGWSAGLGEARSSRRTWCSLESSSPAGSFRPPRRSSAARRRTSTCTSATPCSRSSSGG